MLVLMDENSVRGTDSADGGSPPRTRISRNADGGGAAEGVLCGRGGRGGATDRPPDDTDRRGTVAGKGAVRERRGVASEAKG